MTLLSSLRSRVFLASALLAVVSIGVAIYLVNVRVTRETERELQQQLLATGALADEIRTMRTETFTTTARLLADLPKLKAAVETNDPPTVQGVAGGYQSQVHASLVLVAGASGTVLAAFGVPNADATARAVEALGDALHGRETMALLPQSNGLVQMVAVPIEARPQRLGALGVGFLLGDAMAKELKAITGSDIAFGVNGRIAASTLPGNSEGALAPLLASDGVTRVRLGGQEYMALSRRLSPTSAPGGPTMLVLRSRTEQLRFIRAIHAGLAVTAAVAVLFATLLSFAVARTITRPLAAITDAMKDVAATGDLTRKIALGHGRWDDADARLLAATFNTLTDSIARFQQEMAQKERLSSLGRLSTVIAHEIRNPLMIIKASLHGLTRPDVDPAAVREAAADIDGEIARLNHVVNDVLDFARPIRLAPVPTDLNALCRAAAVASETGSTGVPVDLELDPAVPTVMTDPERLRLALVNILVNAQHAVAGRVPAESIPAGAAVESPAGEGPPIALRTAAQGGRVSIVVSDRGPGIPGDHVSRVFDPYFTTRRGGTGLGLAIARSIVEAMGGTITIDSAPGSGTHLRIDLPVDGPAAAALER